MGLKRRNLLVIVTSHERVTKTKAVVIDRQDVHCTSCICCLTVRLGLITGWLVVTDILYAVFSCLLHDVVNLIAVKSTESATSLL